MPDDDPLTREIIGAAIKVSKGLGIGLLESVYETCLQHELLKANLTVESQVSMPVVYDGIRIEAGFRADLIVERAVILELKTLTTVLPVHHAQLLTYMRMSQIRKGLLINFYAFPFAKGIKRFVL